MGIRPLLIFPPGWTPFGPYLALPALKGYLENRDIPCEIQDMNVEFFDYLFTPEFLQECYDITKQRYELLDAKTELTDQEVQLFNKYARALLGHQTIADIQFAKDTIRSEEYYDLDKANHTKNILYDALQLVASRYEGSTFRFNKISLKYSQKSTRQVLLALDDGENNPFIQFFERKVIPQLQESDRNFLGLSVTSESQLLPALTLAKLVREQCPNIQHITFGGNLTTRLASGWSTPHPFFNFFDTLIIYEGEEGLYQLIQALENETDLSNVPNLCYVRDGELLKNSSITINVHELAVPNFDGFPMDKYFMPELVLPLYSAKSCYARCTFCTIPYASHGKYRILEIDHIYEIMRDLADKYNTKYFTFVDETFAPNTMRKIADKLIENNADFLWYGETRFTKGFTKEFCDHIYKGGCRKIQFGLESAVQRVLDKMKKNTKVEWIEPTLLNCFEAGIAVHLFFMIGFPTEERHEALHTLNFTRRMLDISRNVYNNPHTTRGFGSFGLDKYSGVWLNPDEYGVKLIDPGEDFDLALSLDYEATIGLTAEEADEIVALYNQNPYYLLHQSGYQSFHDSVNKLHAEEEPFLRLCRNESTEKSRQTHFPVRIRLRQQDAVLRLALDEHTSFWHMNRDLSRKRLDMQKNILFYNSLSRRYFQVDSDYIDEINRLGEGSLRVGDVLDNPQLTDIVEELLYYEMAVLEQHPVAFAEYDAANSLLLFDKHTTKVGNGEKEVVVFNRVTGTMMKMNHLSYGLLQLLDGDRTIDELVSHLAQNEVRIDRGRFVRLVELALLNGVVQLVEKGLPTPLKGGERYVYGTTA